MTFIEMLQQGGYILPQYNSAQQTYAVPNNGMQALQAIMQIDQQSQNRYIQGEQLNIQRSQNTQSIINSTIQNELNRKTQERLQKQMDLANEKLKFEMQKEILADIDEQRKYLKDNFLGRDQIKIQESMEKMGLDPNSILTRMKGNMNLENYMNEAFAVRAFYASQKNAFSNMQKYGEAKQHIAKNEQNLKRAEEFAKKGWLDDTVYQKYFKSLNKATADTVGFENGSVQDIDFSDKNWSSIVGFPDFLDEIQMKKTLKIEEQIKKAKMEEDLADAKYKTANAAMLTGTLDSRIKLNKAKAALDIAKANNEIDDLQFAQEQRKLKNADWELWLGENPSATAKERDEARKSIYSDNPTKPDLISSTNELLARKLDAEGASSEDIIEAQQRFNASNKTTNVNYNYPVKDATGKTIGLTNNEGVTDWGGYRTKGSEFVDGSFGGLPVSLANPSHKKLFEEGKLVFKDGKLRIKGNTVAKDLFGVSQSWGDFWEINDSVIEKAIPGIKQDGEYWEIPYDNKPLPQQSAGSGGSGAPFFNGVAPATGGSTGSNVVSKYYSK